MPNPYKIPTQKLIDKDVLLFLFYHRYTESYLSINYHQVVFYLNIVIG